MTFLSNAASEFAKVTADALKVPYLAILAQDADGVVTLVSHGFDSHAHLNSVLSVGIHANLSEHDKLVRSGAAGADAQETAQRIITAS